MEGIKNILITGGFGNLGSWLTEYLVNAGFHVIVLTKSGKNTQVGFPHDIVLCDIQNQEEIYSKLKNIELHYVIHTASRNDIFIPDYPKESILVNALGTRNLLEALSGKNIHNFIYFSTFHVYGKKSGFIDESNEIRAENDYSITHYFAEEYIRLFYRSRNIPFTILRLTNSYGCPKNLESSKWYLLLNDLSKMSFHENRIRLNSNGKPKRDFIWMGTVCEVVHNLLNLQVAPNDTFNLSSERSYSIFEIAEIVKEAWKEFSRKDIPIILNENDNSMDAELLISSSRLKKIVSYTVIDNIKAEALKIFKMLQK